MKIEINLGRETEFVANDSLFDVYVLDYGDNYHKLEGEPSSEFEKSVHRIRARYKSLSAYNDAICLYREWMNYLAEKHGGEDILKKKIKADLITDYIPRKPRLKNSPTLKYYYKNNIIVSSPVNFEIDYELMDDLIRNIYGKEGEQSGITVKTTRIKEAERLIDGSENVVRHKVKSHAFESDADFLNGYWRNRTIKYNKPSKKKDKKKNKKDKFLISDVIAGCYDYDENDVDNSEESLMRYNGLLLTNGVTKEMAIYHRLNDIGWNSYKLMKRANYGKRVSNVFKPQKKGKKKKYKYGFDTQSSYDGLVIDIAQEAGYDNFEDFSNAMLNLSEDDFMAEGIIIRDNFKY